MSQNSYTAHSFRDDAYPCLLAYDITARTLCPGLTGELPSPFS